LLTSIPTKCKYYYL